jgi:hypothetical protein
MFSFPEGTEGNSRRQRVNLSTKSGSKNEKTIHEHRHRDSGQRVV